MYPYSPFDPFPDEVLGAFLPPAPPLPEDEDLALRVADRLRAYHLGRRTTVAGPGAFPRSGNELMVVVPEATPTRR
jgi:hypothetical protein